jgi:hypothetical protein
MTEGGAALVGRGQVREAVGIVLPLLLERGLVERSKEAQALSVLTLQRVRHRLRRRTPLIRLIRISSYKTFVPAEP